MLDLTKCKKLRPMYLEIYQFCIAMKEWFYMDQLLERLEQSGKFNMKLFLIDCVQTISTQHTGELNHFFISKMLFKFSLITEMLKNLFNKNSLYRATNQTEAEEKFNAFMNRLPTFVSIAKEVSVYYNYKHKRIQMINYRRATFDEIVKYRVFF